MQIDADTTAFNDFMAALHFPKDTAEQRDIEIRAHAGWLEKGH